MKPVLHNLVGLCAAAVERQDKRVHNALKRIPGQRINGQSERQSNMQAETNKDINNSDDDESIASNKTTGTNRSSQ